MKPSICWKPGLALAPLVLLAGCGGASTENAADDPANAAVQRGPMLGDVDLSAPLQLRPVEGRDWALDLAPGRILFQQEGAKDVPFYPVSPRMQGNAAVYPTQTPDGAAVTITLKPARCAEGSALAAEVKIGTRLLQGCAFAMTVEQVHREMYNEALAVPYDAGNNSSD
ncbi:hypothetical protein [Sphingomonas sp. TDK1]|uniref:hypothetical protein n=1 Tax=Sphingomonas sp. TDK1 TaxID=453247 RepID=UPI0007D998AE|nr:hypothetical protein [Sphingomonas sp. TDK1]OAN57170.1 hypothetical protein A7X12_08060 [Sphingomonas sp. TDK1]